MRRSLTGSTAVARLPPLAGTPRRHPLPVVAAVRMIRAWNRVLPGLPSAAAMLFGDPQAST